MKMKLVSIEITHLTCCSKTGGDQEYSGQHSQHLINLGW